MPRKRLKPSGAVFLDRDGVINVHPGDGFVTNIEQFKFLPGVLKALKKLHEYRQIVIVVSNQSAVGRGLMSMARLRAITRQMVRKVRMSGGCLHAVYYCPHHPKAGCFCRKPLIGLLKKASRRFSIDLKKSFVVGDDVRDIRMGHSAGCQTILVLTGKQTRKAARQFQQAPHRIVKNLSRATKWILEQQGVQ